MMRTNIPAVSAFDRVEAALRSRGHELKQTPNKGWLTWCPAHESPASNPSCNFDRGIKGVVVKCRSADCTMHDIATALGLSEADFFDERKGAGDAAVRRSGNDARVRGSAKPNGAGWPSADAALAWAQSRHRTAEKIEAHDYFDADDKHVLRVVRIDKLDAETGKRSKTFLQFRSFIHYVHGARWESGSLKDGRPLFNLRQLLTMTTDTVLVVEGERCVAAAGELGLLAVTSSQGAQCPEKSDWSPLKGRRVVIVPDHDAPGTKYANAVRELMQQAGAEVVRTLTLDGLDEGGDLVDWIDARKKLGTDKERIAAELEDLIDDVLEQPGEAAKDAEAEPPPEAKEEEPQAEAKKADWTAIGLDELLTQSPVEWLVDGFVPSSSVSLLAGHPGTGKSFLALDLALRITHGMPLWLGQKLTGHGPVAYLALEGNAGLAGRARAWRVEHGGERQVHPFAILNTTGAVPLSEDGAASTMAMLHEFCEKHGGIALLIVDTLTLAIEGDENDAAAVRSALRVATEAARDLRCAVLLLHHLRKDKPGERSTLDLGSVRGSGALVGNVDQVIGVIEGGGEDGKLRTPKVTCMKAKDGERPKPVGFELYQILTGQHRRDGTPETSCAVRTRDIRNDSTSSVGADAAEGLKQNADKIKLIEASRKLGKMVSADALCTAAKVSASKGGRTLIELLEASGEMVKQPVAKGRFLHGVPELMPKPEPSRPDSRPDDGETTTPADDPQPSPAG